MGVTSTGCRRQARTKRESGADIQLRLPRLSRSRIVPPLRGGAAAWKDFGTSLLFPVLRAARVFKICLVSLERRLALREIVSRDRFRHHLIGEGLSIGRDRRCLAQQRVSACVSQAVGQGYARRHSHLLL